jgi:hypothetical protein
MHRNNIEKCYWWKTIFFLKGFLYNEYIFLVIGKTKKVWNISNLFLNFSAYTYMCIYIYIYLKVFSCPYFRFYSCHKVNFLKLKLQEQTEGDNTKKRKRKMEALPKVLVPLLLFIRQTFLQITNFCCFAEVLKEEGCPWEVETKTVPHRAPLSLRRPCPGQDLVLPSLPSISHRLGACLPWHIPAKPASLHPETGRPWGHGGLYLVLPNLSCRLNKSWQTRMHWLTARQISNRTSRTKGKAGLVWTF